MTSLPPALRPWAPWLTALAPAVQEGLGKWLPRLGLAIGPMVGRGEAGQGEPDGYEGLTRRGSYERLLATEWLLADEVPDEFLRRAAVGEHLFLRPVQRDSVSRRRCVVLCDEGPDQLGSPRLVHLAALLVLARRAEEAGAAFGWGVLQSRPLTLESGVGGRELTTFVRSRSGRPATVDDLRTWRAHLGQEAPRSGRKDEVWIIGGRRWLEPLRAWADVRLLQVDDPLDPDGDHVQVGLPGRGLGRQGLSLPLPDPRTRVRLLRDPLRVARARAAAAPTLQPGTGMLFTPGAHRLIARTEGGGLIAWHVPNSPRAVMGHPRKLNRPEAVPLAATYKSKTLLVLALLDDALVLLSVGRRSGVSTTWSCELPPAMRHLLAGVPPVLQRLVMLQGRGCLYFDSGSGLLFKVESSGAHEIADAVLAPPWSVSWRSSAYLFEPPGRPGAIWAGTLDMDGELDDQMQLADMGPEHAPNRSAPLFGFAGGTSGVFGAVGVPIGPGRWRFYTGIVAAKGPSSFGLEGPEAGEVLGFARLGSWGEKWAPGLVVLREDRQTFEYITASDIRHLARATAPVVSTALSPDLPWLAWQDEEGNVAVRSLPEETTLCRMQQERP